jgi:hypothetical protein
MKPSKLRALYVLAEEATTHEEAIKVLKKAKKAELKSIYKEYCNSIESI